VGYEILRQGLGVNVLLCPAQMGTGARGGNGGLRRREAQMGQVGPGK
jgi:hypothetical protein